MLLSITVIIALHKHYVNIDTIDFIYHGVDIWRVATGMAPGLC